MGARDSPWEGLEEEEAALRLRPAVALEREQAMEAGPGALEKRPSSLAPEA